MAIRLPERQPVQEVDDLWIPLADGGRLSAHLWLPPAAAKGPVPAIVEVSPYRHEDNTRRRDAVRHPYFAEHGYASLRVDIRGSGASSGVLMDEYTEQEQGDVCAVLEWVSSQSWCSGPLGMIGISWGGFAALQAAARRPPNLRAVVAVCASADRYGADVKFHGGCVLASELLPWSSTMYAMSARPPDPELVGAGWRDLWLERLEGALPYAEEWLSHQRRDDYWRCGSPADDYAAIECPVYAVGGWADPYRQAVLDLLESLAGPRKGLIGPWAHRYPEEGTPGPAFDFRAECVRWWDRWLKGEENGVMDEPMLHAWMPEPARRGAPGRWVTERSWPPLRPAGRGYALGDSTLSEEPGSEVAVAVSSTESVGLDAGAWCPWDEHELPAEQGRDDALSLTFTSAPLERRLEILGSAALEVDVASDRKAALLVARLCDVAPDGSSQLVTRGLLNLTHRAGSAHPVALVPNRRVGIRVPLEAIAHVFLPGHRLRVSVGTSYWPWAWPSSERPTVTLFTGPTSRLELPVRPRRRDDRAPGSSLPVDPPGVTGTREITHDAETGRWTLLVDRIRGRRQVGGRDLEVERGQTDVYTIVDGDPLSARVECSRVMGLAREAWCAHVETKSEMSSDADAFLLRHRLEAYENGKLLFSREREVRIPRDLV